MVSTGIILTLVFLPLLISSLGLMYAILETTSYNHVKAVRTLIFVRERLLCGQVITNKWIRMLIPTRPWVLLSVISPPLVIAPSIIVLVWGICVAVLVDPVDGLSILFGVPAGCVFLAAFRTWYFMGFMPSWIVGVTFAAATALYVLLLLCLIFVISPTTVVGTTSVFMAFNLLFVIGSAFANAPTLKFSVFLQRIVDRNDNGKSIKNRVRDWWYRFKDDWRRHFRGILFYLCSLGVLLIYALILQLLNSSGARTVGWIISLSVILLDAFLATSFLLDRIHTRTDVIFLAFLCRIVVSAGGGTGWFVSQSILFVLFATALPLPTLRTIYPAEVERRQLLAAVHASQGGNEEGEGDENEERTSVRGSLDRYTVLVNLFVGLGIDVALYLVYLLVFVIGIILVGTGIFYNPKVSIFGESYESYSCGIAAILVNISLLLTYCCHRCFLMLISKNELWTLKGSLLIVVHGVILWFVVGISAFIVFGLTLAYSILGVGIFGPPVITISLVGWYWWQDNSFHLFITPQYVNKISGGMRSSSSPQPSMPPSAGPTSPVSDIEGGGDSLNVTPTMSSIVNTTANMNTAKRVVDDSGLAWNWESSGGGISIDPAAIPDVITMAQRRRSSQNVVTNPESPRENSNVYVLSVQRQPSSVTPPRRASRDFSEENSERGENTRNVPLAVFIIRDVLFVCGCCLLILLLWGWGLLYILTITPSYFGLCWGMAPVILLTSFVPIYQLKHIAQYTHSITVSLIVSGVLLLLFATLLVSVFMSSYSSSFRGVLWLAIMLGYPPVVMTLSALVWWKKHHWRFHWLVPVLLGISAVMLLIFCFLIMFFSITWSLILLVVYVLGTYGAITLGVYIYFHFYIPLWYYWSVFVVFTIVVIISIIIAFSTNFSFWGVSVGWVLTCICLGFICMYKLSNNPNQIIAFGPRLFPCYAYSVKKGDMRSYSHYLGGLYTAFLMWITWGLWAVMVAEPSEFGLAVMSLGIVGGAYYGFSKLYGRKLQIMQDKEYIDVGVVVAMKEKALEIESKRSSSLSEEILEELNKGKHSQLYKDYQKRLDAEWLQMWNTSDYNKVLECAKGWWKLDKERRALYDSETRYLLRYELLVAMSAEYSRKEFEREILHYLKSKGFEDMNLDDIKNWPEDTLNRVKKIIRLRKYEREQRIRMIEDGDKSGKRSKVKQCDTIFPLFSNKDVVSVHKKFEELNRESQDHGGKWTDFDFQPYDALGKGKVWERPDSLIKQGKPVLFENGAEAADVCQGAIGDCWLMAGISSVSNRDNTIEELFLEQDHGLKNGIHVVKLFHNQTWWAIFLDDQFPARNGTFLFGHSATKNELWVSLVEKACAKMWGDYEQLVSGLPHQAMATLTGFPTESVWHTAKSERVVSGQLWHELLRWKEQGFFIGAGSEGEGNDQDSRMGIAKSHAYSVLDVREIDGFRLLQLRNPWGHMEWEGSWSDGDSMWKKHPKVKNKIKPENGDDGSFWMQFEDYTQFFDTTECVYYMCGSDWMDRSLEFDFEEPWSDAEFQDDYFGMSPQVWLTVKKGMFVSIILEQPERVEMDTQFGIQLQIAHKGGKNRLTKVYGWKRDMETRSQRRATKCSWFDPHDDPYNLIITWENKEGNSWETRKHRFPIKITVRFRASDQQHLSAKKVPVKHKTKDLN